MIISQERNKNEIRRQHLSFRLISSDFISILF